MRQGLSLAVLLAAVVGGSAGATQARPPQEPAERDPSQVRLHPAALAELIDELGGRPVSLPTARVIAVVNPRAFLIESASPLPATRGNLDRVVVLVERGRLHVDGALLVGSTVSVVGVARTVLGAQVMGDVPWPPELTRQVLQRYEIRAAVLAASVATTDGVNLVEQP